MKSYLRFTISIVLSCIGLASAAPKAAPVYWRGHSGRHVYQWTEKDLTASDLVTGRRVYSVVRALKREFARQAPDEIETYYEVAFMPLSVVGALLSYERDDAWEGGAHPSGTETFVTLDVRRPDRRMKLTDLFPSEQIRRALLADSLVKHVLQRDKIAPPSTLQALVTALKFKEFGGDSDSMYAFPGDLLEDFAFHHVAGGKVAVRFLLPHGSEIYRFQHTQLGILLPIPERMKIDFERAASGAQGALMPELKRVAGTHKSTLILIDRSGHGH